ncbi:MAG: phage terminase large subunit [Phycisphaeraceae bacterium]|nr:phage terminase large subunit [Phycisphaeraceae bacterium]
MTISPIRLASLNAGISACRRKVGAAGPELFAKLYLGQHLRLPPSRMHTELFVLLSQTTERRGRHIAVAAPRGHAKSTVVSLAYVLWSILYDRDRFVLLVSATREQTVQMLRNVKQELQNNPFLLADFPEVCQPAGARGLPQPWRDNSIALHNGAMVRAMSACQALRGLRNGRYRPSLVVVDDLEDQQQCESADARHKLRDWFEKTLLKVGDSQTNFIIVGTILHYDALLARLTGPCGGRGQSAGWESRIYRAIEAFSEHPRLWEQWEAIFCGEEAYQEQSGPQAAELFFAAHREQMLAGTCVLWPEMEDYYRLMQIRIQEGPRSFQSEKQNQPLDPEKCIFNEDHFHYWDQQYADAAELLRAIGSQCQIYGACDPSMGSRAHRGDYTAIITVAHHRPTKTTFVLDADLVRRTPSQTIERIVALGRQYGYREFAVEANQFQDVMAEQLRQRAIQANLHFNLRKVTHTGNKQARIEAIEPLIASGAVRLHRRQTALLEQLRQFPLGAHDDGPDALEMVIKELVNRQRASSSHVAGLY